MRATFDLSHTSIDDFEANCNVAISKVGTGSKKALIAACNEILDMSLMQVPVDTSTLSQSAFYEITGHWLTGWNATLGYGGNGDPINPKTGKPASSYMLAVHEDLSAYHILGKAKYLEDPVREYAREKFPRTVFKYASESLAGK